MKNLTYSFVRTISLSSCIFFVNTVNAELLTDVIPDLLKSHNEILAAKADKESASFDLKKEEAAWPSF